MHVNDARSSLRQGVLVPIEDAAPAMTLGAPQEAALQLCDLDRAMQLAEEQRQVLLLVGLKGLSCSFGVGAVRSRLGRGRDELRQRQGMGSAKCVPQRSTPRDDGNSVGGLDPRFP